MVQNISIIYLFWIEALFSIFICILIPLMASKRFNSLLTSDAFVDISEVNSVELYDSYSPKTQLKTSATETRAICSKKKRSAKNVLRKSG